MEKMQRDNTSPWRKCKEITKAHGENALREHKSMEKMQRDNTSPWRKCIEITQVHGENA